MATIVDNQSLNVLRTDVPLPTTAEMELAYGALIANYQRQTISQVMRNENLLGTLTSGSVRAARYANSTSQPYGTARTNLRAQALRELKVLVEIKEYREIPEEFEEFDQRTMPDFFQQVISGRNTNMADTMARDRETDFFTTARDAGTAVAVAGATPDVQFENLVLNLTTLQNEFFHGIDRNMIYVIMTDAAYSAFRVNINRDMANPNVNSAAEKFIMHNGVRVFPSPYLPLGVSRIVMARGSVAMPQLVLPFRIAQEPYSFAHIVKIAYAMTATAVMPDTIFYTV